MNSPSSLTTPGTPYFTPATSSDSPFQTPDNSVKKTPYRTRLVEWFQTPFAKQPKEIKLDNTELKQELEFMYECLEELVEVSDDDLLSFVPLHREILGSMIYKFGSNMTQLENDYHKYEQLYEITSDRFKADVFKGYFPVLD
ncbi:MAG: hypothetical protein JSR58_01790 [Verrucomicrobia bacterium]|nr:hypothetical protein [Verrucomicrobiota bacterium]